MFGLYPHYPPSLPALPIWKINFDILQDIASCKEVLEKYGLFACIQYDSSLHISSMCSNIDILFRGNKYVSVREFSGYGIKSHEIKAKKEEDLRNDLSCLLEKIFGQNNDK